MGDIVWLASYPKSGNTWMRAFVHNLFRDPGEPLDINRMHGGLSQGESFKMWYAMLDRRPVDEWTPEDVARLRPRVHETIARGFSGSGFCKIHGALMTSRGHPTVNMAVSSGAIYIVRNPLDVTLSYADFMGLGIDRAIDQMATENMESGFDDKNVPTLLGSWSQHVASWTAAGNRRVHVARYEDMLAGPSKTFGAVARFLKLKPSRARLERAIRNSSFAVLAGQERKRGFGEKSRHQKRFFRSGKAGEWKTGLTAAQTARVVEAHREQMARFGYLPPGM